MYTNINRRISWLIFLYDFSCLTASLGNYLSQKMSKAQHINQDSIVAFGLFGLFFGGPVPHYFYRYIPYFVKNPLAILAVERLLYTPCFQGLALYMIARFEVQMQKKKKMW